MSTHIHANDERLKEVVRIWNLPDDQREAVYYANFLKAIETKTSERQEELKEEYKKAYLEMRITHDRLTNLQNNNREKSPGSFRRSYTSTYYSGNFLINWNQKQVCYQERS